ncbi:hypothetical protein [Prevotella sp. 10(H)]|uniref:hypothetical protein n=1 Tax=Prevotella sp. 10(H) TaxID=1158294 RepID=UPI0012DEA7D7|nr:hypothetical protein [Prevotella sp. 10(H)]
MGCKYIIIMLLALTMAIGLNAQIVVGGDKQPEDFCIVEVEGSHGGIRLPRLTDVEKDAMIPSLRSNPKSSGLVIYNTVDSIIEYWDGDRWIILMNNLGADNGLTKEDRKIRLGGPLNQPVTTIDMDDKAFNFKNSAAAKFMINDTMVVVNNKVVDIRPARRFTVNDTVIDIRGKVVDIRPGNFSVNNSTFTMSEADRTSIKKHFRYTDGNQAQGRLLAADNEGNAYWGALRPLGTLLDAKLNNSKIFATTTVDITNGYLELTAGQWLIFAKYNSNMTASPDGMYHWIHLSARKKGQTTYSDVAMAGANPEKKNAGWGMSYATPYLMHYVNIKEPHQYIVRAGTSNAGGSTTVDESWIGKSYFYAMRIDIPTDESTFTTNNLKIICPAGTISLKRNTNIADQTISLNYTLTGSDSEKIASSFIGYRACTTTNTRHLRVDMDTPGAVLSPGSGTILVKLSGQSPVNRTATGANNNIKLQINEAICDLKVTITN